MTIKSNDLPSGQDRDTTATVVDLDTGRRAAARTPGPPRAAAPPPGLQHAAAISAFERAAKAVREDDPHMAFQFAHFGLRALAEAE